MYSSAARVSPGVVGHVAHATPSAPPLNRAHTATGGLKTPGYVSLAPPGRGIRRGNRSAWPRPSSPAHCASASALSGLDAPSKNVAIAIKTPALAMGTNPLAMATILLAMGITPLAKRCVPLAKRIVPLAKRIVPLAMGKILIAMATFFIAGSSQHVALPTPPVGA